MSEDDLIRKPVGKHTQAEAERESDKEDGHKRGGMLGPMLLLGSGALGLMLWINRRGRGGHEL